MLEREPGWTLVESLPTGHGLMRLYLGNDDDVDYKGLVGIHNTADRKFNEMVMTSEEFEVLQELVRGQAFIEGIKRS